MLLKNLLTDKGIRARLIIFDLLILYYSIKKSTSERVKFVCKSSWFPFIRSVETTMVYTHVVAEMHKGKVASPLDM